MLKLLVNKKIIFCMPTTLKQIKPNVFNKKNGFEWIPKYRCRKSIAYQFVTAIGCNKMLKLINYPPTHTNFYPLIYCNSLNQNESDIKIVFNRTFHTIFYYEIKPCEFTTQENQF